MTDQAQLQAVADSLKNAYDTRVGVTPPRLTITDMTVGDAYAIQQLQEQAFIAAGHTVVGRKIGLTSLAMQQQLGVDSPDFGFFTDKLLFSPDQPVAVDRFLAAKVEPELGFKLARDLPAGATLEEALEAIESVHLAVEIIDSRVRDWDIQLVDTIADNASCGAVIMDPNPAAISLAELADVPAAMFINGDKVGAGQGSDVMGHPVKPIVWLADTLHEMGTRLRAGDIILSGSFCGAAPVASNQEVVIDYGAYGKLHTTFV